MSSYLTRRDGIWHYARRVPLNLVEFDRRGVVKQSTKVRCADDPRGVRAGKIAEGINLEVEAYWRGLLSGSSADAQQRYDEVRRKARGFGFEYLTAGDLAQVSDVREILARLAPRRTNDDEDTTAAVLGGESPPTILLSKLFEEYAALTEVERRDMSLDQLRQWRNPRVRALDNLLEVLGDKPIARLTRDDAMRFQDWWRERLVNEGLEIGSANRDIGTLNKMLTTLERRHQFGLGKLFGDMRIGGGRDKSRLPYSVPFLQMQLLADGALASLNDEARRVIFLLVETGLRPSEAVNLTREHIVLDGAVPHVRVRANGRRLKTEQSERDIPLVGVSLLAAQAQPDGFPRYRDNSAGLSAIANKVMRMNGLRPAEGQTIYSLRHSFEDRLGDVECPEKTIAALMGHKHARPKYGAGPTLAHKHKWLQEIALTPPSSV